MQKWERIKLINKLKIPIGNLVKNKAWQIIYEENVSVEAEGKCNEETCPVLNIQ